MIIQASNLFLLIQLCTFSLPRVNLHQHFNLMDSLTKTEAKNHVFCCGVLDYFI